MTFDALSTHNICYSFFVLYTTSRASFPSSWSQTELYYNILLHDVVIIHMLVHYIDYALEGYIISFNLGYLA